MVIGSDGNICQAPTDKVCRRITGAFTDHGLVSREYIVRCVGHIDMDLAVDKVDTLYGDNKCSSLTIKGHSPSHMSLNVPRSTCPSRGNDSV